ncbi:hypothetical protein OEV98_10860 [Caldibacillus lycopersici]|uniref:Uncharacterized protein n=1 Tax=Perspicuibacillus lycopersici TaxID=1325689 RepID=A0AAE3IVD3_9BACI|nr:hypothetical protein [Perspicuibacillus lycopersici]MCU9614059.1 hypothetical protein [Perspicuibacillus lycopersici]
MGDLGTMLLEKYNALADKVVGWEVDLVNDALGNLLLSALNNLEIILPLTGIACLFIIKSTRPFAVGSLIIGLLLL